MQESWFLDYFDLRSSLITSEATILCALKREESRGSHQRSDFPSLNNSYDCNFQVSLKGVVLVVDKKNLLPMKENLKKYIKGTKLINNFEGKLLE